MQREIIPNHLAVLHHKTNALEFGYVGYGIARYRGQIGKFSRLNGANLVLPSQHFFGIDGAGTDHIKCRDSGSVQIEQGGDTGLAAGILIALDTTTGNNTPTTCSVLVN